MPCARSTSISACASNSRRSTGSRIARSRKRAKAGKIPYYAVGTIYYGDADGADCPNGLILYIKPAIHDTSDTEGAGVRSYATAHKTFPHEPTADQWFSESQFESYRSLALDIANDIFKGDIDARYRARQN